MLALKPYPYSDLVNTYLEISVMKKLKEFQIQGLKESCRTAYGGICETSSLDMCSYCALKEDIRNLTAHFESYPGNVNSSKFK